MMRRIENSRSGIARAAGCASVLLVILSGCTFYDPYGHSDYGMTWRYVKALFGDSSDRAFTEQDVLDIPFASIGIRVGSKPMALVVLKSVNGRKLTWQAADRGIFVIENGRLIATGGFPNDLNGTTALGAHDYFAEGLNKLTEPVKYRRSYDFTKEQMIGVPAECTIYPEEMEPITLFETELSTRRVDEKCEVDALDWSFENSYWVDTETGRIWRSIQHAHPDVPEIEFEIQRPANVPPPG